jgi:undecaprenyl-diphosphatase
LILSGFLAYLIVNFIKNTIERIRPLNDMSINDGIRILIEATDYSFVSGHATLSFFVAFFSYWILNKRIKRMYLIFLFPMFFAYSRIYLAAHFPTDILAGFLLAYLFALGFTRLIQITVLKE